MVRKKIERPTEAGAVRRSIKIRSILLLSLGIMACLQAVTGAESTFDAWKAYTLAAQAERLNKVADHLFTAVANFGFERGRVNVVLSDAGPVSAMDNNRKFIAARRQEGNSALAKGLRELAAIGSGRESAEVESVASALAKVDELRRRAEVEMVVEKPKRTSGLAREWFAAMTELIERIETLLRRASLEIRNADAQLARLTRLKVRVLSLRNTAGPEISILTGTMRSGTPITQDLAKKIATLEVETTFHLATLSQLFRGDRQPGHSWSNHAPSGSVSVAIPGQQGGSLFGSVGRAGPYPISPDVFLASGVAALETIADLMKIAVSETAKLALEQRQDATLHLAIQMGLLSTSLMLIALIIIAVHRRVVTPLPPNDGRHEASIGRRPSCRSSRIDPNGRGRRDGACLGNLQEASLGFAGRKPSTTTGRGGFAGERDAPPHPV